MKPQKIKYAPLFAAMLLCVALAGCGGAPHESGEAVFRKVKPKMETRAAPRADAVRAAAGGDIALPATLAAPQTDSTINTLLDAGVLSGAFTTVNSCRTRDLCTAGEITVRVRAELDAQTSRKDAKFALWKLADGRAEYLETVYFTCDGTVQSYTFSRAGRGCAVPCGVQLYGVRRAAHVGRVQRGGRDGRDRRGNTGRGGGGRRRTAGKLTA